MARKTKQSVLLEPTETNTDSDVKRNQSINNALTVKIDHLKTFDPLTENQRLFFEMYKGGGYFIGLFGSPGVGKCQGEDVEVNLMVSDEIYEKLKNIS